MDNHHKIHYVANVVIAVAVIAIAAWLWGYVGIAPWAMQ